MKTALCLTVITLLLGASSLSAATLYVSLESTNPTPPYTNWATAATSIQQAADAAQARDTVLVTNGVYLGGVSVTKPLALLSLNGPRFTVISDGRNQQCISLTDGASLTGFTLTNGWSQSGGGVSCTSTKAILTNCTLSGNGAVCGGGAYGGTLYNCTLTGNNAESGGGACGSTLYNCMLTSNTVWGGMGGDFGGGASGCALYNCTLTANSASSANAPNYGGGVANCTLYNCLLIGNFTRFVESYGGGAYNSTLYNCTLTANSATGGFSPSYGGGAYGSTLYNCVVYDNGGEGPNYNSCILNYCCTTPLPTNGVGNITDAPLFVDYAHGNLRLQSNSPCINAGNNAYVTTTTDLDGRPRIVGGTVDMGAYEFQPGVSGAFIGWLPQYGLPTDGSADFIDSDGDGMNNWQEWVCGTDPTNALSVLRLLSPSITGTNATVTWQSVAGVSYFLERGANLGSPFMLLATNIVGQAGTTSYADTNATGAGPFFYRVGVGK